MFQVIGILITGYIALYVVFFVLAVIFKWDEVQ